MDTKNNSILLIKIRLYATDAYYMAAAGEGFLYFYRVRKKDIIHFTRNAHNKKPAEKSLSLGRLHLKLAVSSISSVAICGERSPWSMGNMGTLQIMADGKAYKFLISDYAGAAQTEAFFRSAGCENIAVTNTDIELHKSEPSLKGGKARKLSRRLSRLKGFWSSAAFMILFWLFIIPNYFNIGVMILLVLTLFSLVVLIAFQAYFAAAAGKRGSKNFWANLLSSAILPPILLLIILLQSFDFIVPAAVYIVIPIAALVITAFFIIKFKRLRNRGLAIGMFFFTAAIFFSAVLGLNYILPAATLKNDAGFVEELTYKRSGGYRHHTTYYYATVSYAADRRQYKKIKIPVSVYRTLYEDMPVHLSLRRGIFGVEWYELHS